MSKITSVYDGLLAVALAQLPAYVALPNPYELAENPEILLTKGLAVAIGAGTDSERQICSNLTTQRTFTVVFINRLVTTETNTAALATQAKALMEDAFLVAKYIENNPTIGGASVNATYSDDTGIQYLAGQTGKFYSVEMNFSIEYFDAI